MYQTKSSGDCLIYTQLRSISLQKQYSSANFVSSGYSDGQRTATARDKTLALRKNSAKIRQYEPGESLPKKYDRNLPFRNLASLYHWI